MNTRQIAGLAFAAIPSMLALQAKSQGEDIEVIYTEIASDPSSIVPGALDLAGQPAVAVWTAILNVGLNHDGSQWVVRGFTNQGTDLQNIVVLGSGLTGTAFAQEAQPIPGGLPGELYDFFDGPNAVSWDEQNNIGWSFRAKGGVASVFEKLAFYDAATKTQTIVLQMGAPALGLIDAPANPTGDEAFGNTMNSVHLRNDGTIGFVNTPIGNCHSSRYPAFFHNNTAFMQSGVTMIDFETWDNFDSDACGGTPDGLHWFAIGDTENPTTTLDHIFAVDGVKIVQENTEIGKTGVIAGSNQAVFFCRMLTSGDWYARGDDTADNDWALRNNVMIAKTGDPITTGASENWGAIFSSFHGNLDGDWVLVGNTNNADLNADNVVVRNGEDVLVREGDPVDLDGDGEFNDDVFINTFGPNDVFLTDDDMLYFRATLRNGAAVSLGDAFLRLDVGTEAPCTGDLVVDGTVNVLDLLSLIGAWGATIGPADLNNDGAVNVLDLLQLISVWGACP